MGGQLSKVVSIDALDEHDIVIAIIGQSGVGRSTFINAAVGREILPVRRTNKAETRDIQHVGWLIQNNNQTQRVILVEVPGPDVISEKKLKSWLGKIFAKKIRISAIILLHRITDDKFSPAPLPLLEKTYADSLVGFPNHVALVTTMWNGGIPGSVAESRMKELQATWSKCPWATRSTLSEVQRFIARSPKTATDIMTSLLKPNQMGEENLKDQKEAMKLAITREREGREAAERDAKEAKERLMSEMQRHEKDRREFQAKEIVERDMREELESEVQEAREQEMKERRAKEREAREAKEAREREAEERRARELLDEQLREIRKLMEMERRAKEVELRDWAAKEQKAKVELAETMRKMEMKERRGREVLEKRLEAAEQRLSEHGRKADSDRALRDKLEREVEEVKEREMRARQAKEALEHEVIEFKEREEKLQMLTRSLKTEAVQAREAEARERQHAEKTRDLLARERETGEAVTKRLWESEQQLSSVVAELVAARNMLGLAEDKVGSMERKLGETMGELDTAREELRLAQGGLRTVMDRANMAEGNLKIMEGDLFGTRDRLIVAENELAVLQRRVADREARIDHALTYEKRIWDERIDGICEKVKADLAIQAEHAIVQLNEKLTFDKHEAIEQMHTKWKTEYNSRKFYGTLEAENQRRVERLMKTLDVNLDKLRKEWDKRIEEAEKAEKRKWREEEVKEIQRVKAEWAPMEQEALTTLERLLRGQVFPLSSVDIE